MRNALHRQLTYLFHTPDWYLHLGQAPGLENLQATIDSANDQMHRRREILSADKVVAELTFGFWVSLFNRAYESTLWKQLRLAFPHLPKADRQRATVSAMVNAVRGLRNRVYHNEPICWNLAELGNTTPLRN